MTIRFDSGGIQKDVKRTHKIITCHLCGCKQYTTNYAKHIKTKKHKEADYACNKFEVEKYEPPLSKKNDFLILR